LTANDTAFVWDTAVAALGRQDPRAASALVGRLQHDARATPEVRARRLYEDALRLATVDSAGALARLRAAAAVPGRTETGEQARLELLKGSLSAARTLDDLAPLADSVAAIAARGGTAGSEAVALDTIVARLRRLPDSAGAGVPRGDLRLFLGAENARDGLAAPLLAATLFRRLADDWPASPYVPKALLAAERLDPADFEATRLRLDSLYVDNPYLAVLRGEDAPAYRALEDSLEAFAATQIVRPRPQPGARHGDRDEPAQRRGVAPDEPGSRRTRPQRRPTDPDAPTSRRGQDLQ
jgi:hypothetical protein